MPAGQRSNLEVKPLKLIREAEKVVIMSIASLDAVIVLCIMYPM